MHVHVYSYILYIYIHILSVCYMSWSVRSVRVVFLRAMDMCISEKKVEVASH